MTTPFDKPTVREQLDVVRPDSDDLRDVDLQEAARAVEESEQWREVLTRQQAFDRDVVAAMQDVEVPEGLQDRLLDGLMAARSPEDPLAPSVSDSPPSRRRLLQIATLVAGLLLAVSLGWFLLPRDGSRITLEQARQLPPVSDGVIDLAQLPDFDRSFPCEIPDPAWFRRTVMASPLKGLNWTGDDRHDGAIYEFHVNRRIHGFLLILPASRISDPPELTRMSSSEIGYQPVPNTAWVDPVTNLAYICFVDQGDLRTLQDVLYPHAA